MGFSVTFSGQIESTTLTKHKNFAKILTLNKRQNMAEIPGAVLDRPPSPDPSGEASDIGSTPTLVLPAVASESGAPVAEAGDVIDAAKLPYTDAPIDAGIEDAVLVDDEGRDIPPIDAGEDTADLEDDEFHVAPSKNLFIDSYQADRAAIDADPDSDTTEDQIEQLERRTLREAGIQVNGDGDISIDKGGSRDWVTLDGIEVEENDSGEKRLVVSVKDGTKTKKVLLTDLQQLHWKSPSSADSVVTSAAPPDTASAASTPPSGGPTPSGRGTGRRARPTPAPSPPGSAGTTGASSPAPTTATPPASPSDGDTTSRGGRWRLRRRSVPSPDAGTSGNADTTSTPSSGDSPDTEESDRALENMAPWGPESHAAPSGTVESLWRETKKLMEMDPKSPEAKAIKKQFGDLQNVNMNLDTGTVTDLEGNEHSARDLAHSILEGREAREAAEATRQSPVRRALGRAALRRAGSDTAGSTGGRFDALRRRRDALYERAGRVDTDDSDLEETGGGTS